MARIRNFLNQEAPGWVVGLCLIFVLSSWLAVIASAMPTVMGQ